MASAKSVRLPYLRVIGITEVTGVGGRMTDTDFTPEEETKFRQMAAMPVYLEKKRKNRHCTPVSLAGEDQVPPDGPKSMFQAEAPKPQPSTLNLKPSTQPSTLNHKP